MEEATDRADVEKITMSSPSTAFIKRRPRRPSNSTNGSIATSSTDLSAIMSGTDRPEVPSILVSSPTRQEHDLPADAGARTPTTPSSPFSSGALPTSAAPSPSVRVPPSPFSPPLSSRARPTRTAAGGASPLASPASPAAADTVSTVTSTLSRFTAHRPYRTPDMGLEVLQVDVDTGTPPSFTSISTSANGRFSGWQCIDQSGPLHFALQQR